MILKESAMPLSFASSERFRQWIWKLVFPFFPYVRDGLLKLGIVRHGIRQFYHVGWLRPGRTPRELEEHLRRYGFDEDRIAWVDPGEIVDLRRRVNFEYQYHLRLFEDGELRGHYELTPEYKPIAHLNERDFSDRRGAFLEFLGDWAVTEKPVHQSPALLLQRHRYALSRHPASLTPDAVHVSQAGKSGVPERAGSVPGFSVQGVACASRNGTLFSSITPQRPCSRQDLPMSSMMKSLTREVARWSMRRNERRATINWKFSVQDARSAFKYKDQ